MKDLEQAACVPRFDGGVTEGWKNSVDDIALSNMLFFAELKMNVELSDNPGQLFFLYLFICPVIRNCLLDKPIHTHTERPIITTKSSQCRITRHSSQCRFISRAYKITTGFKP